jgi:MFS-type transporter involved in bile tolerance (Atg22 family)
LPVASQAGFLAVPGTAIVDFAPAVPAMAQVDGVLKSEPGSGSLEQGALPPHHQGALPGLPTVVKKHELDAYYMYSMGANGLALFNFGPTAFQNLLWQAAGDGGLDGGLLPFLGRERDINSIVLVANGISFAIQAVLFLVIGAYADFGTGRRWILIFWSLVAFGVGFAWLGVHDPSQWQTAAGLYMAGLIAYQLTLTYWTAAFPSIARNTERMQEATMAFWQGDTDQETYEHQVEMEKSRISNVAFSLQSVAEMFMLAVITGVMISMKVQDSEAKNNWGLSITIAIATGFWVVFALPWFFWENTREGAPIPPGKNIVTAGLWQIKEALTHIWQLKQSLIYLLGYFLLGDSLNTTVTVIGTLQNQIVFYDTVKLTYLLIVGIAAQALGIWGFWKLQKRYSLGVKPMFNAIMVAIVLLDAWGMIGNWTDKFGFHNVWEIWLYQVFYGLLVCPWYSYSQILISCVTPSGKDFLFFSLFSIIGKTSSFIGPLVSSAIIDATPGGNNNSAPFYFLFGLSLVSAVGIWWFLDLDKSLAEQAAFVEKEKAKLEASGAESN